MMKFLSNSLGVLSLLAALAVHAANTDDMQIYSDQLNNMTQSK